jgi:hypothetical protein
MACNVLLTDEGAHRRHAHATMTHPPGEPGYDPSTLHVPAAALRDMTEFNKQYWAIKSRAMDLVLFVRHGSFYNLFDSDADLGMRVGLNLSGSRAPNMWKCGCTAGAFATWAAKVLALGYSVGRVEEMTRSQAPAVGAGRKLLERRLVKICTPGTAVDGLLAVRAPAWRGCVDMLLGGGISAAASTLWMVRSNII